MAQESEFSHANALGVSCSLELSPARQGGFQGAHHSGGNVSICKGSNCKLQIANCKLKDEIASGRSFCE